MRMAEILPLLPEVLRRTAQPGRPLGALLEAMEGLHARDELILAGLDAYFDPARAPDAFLPYLASWVGLGWVPVAGVRDRMDVTFGVEPAALRRLIAAAPLLAQTRGTAEGLTLLLRTATAVPDIAVTDSPGAGSPARFTCGWRSPRSGGPAAAGRIPGAHGQAATPPATSSCSRRRLLERSHRSHENGSRDFRNDPGGAAPAGRAVRLPIIPWPSSTPSVSSGGRSMPAYVRVSAAIIGALFIVLAILTLADKL